MSVIRPTSERVIKVWTLGQTNSLFSSRHALESPPQIKSEANWCSCGIQCMWTVKSVAFGGKLNDISFVHSNFGLMSNLLFKVLNGQSGSLTPLWWLGDQVRRAKIDPDHLPLLPGQLLASALHSYDVLLVNVIFLVTEVQKSSEYVRFRVVLSNVDLFA